MKSTALSRKKKASRKRGQTLVEYALIIAFVSVLAIGVLQAVGSAVNGTYNTVNNSLETASDGGTAPGDAGGPGAPGGVVPDDAGHAGSP